MKTIHVYEANDGKRFDDKRACQDHDFDLAIRRIAGRAGYTSDAISGSALRNVIKEWELFDELLRQFRSYYDGLVVDKIIERAEHLKW